MADDPIFDPWTTEGSGAPSRWRGGAKESRKDVPGTPPIPEARRRRVVRVESSAPSASPRPRPPKTALAGRLRGLAVPRLEAVEARLRIAGHHMRLDDRLDRDVPSIRFRLIPRRGPFDELDEVAGSTLEIVAEEAEAPLAVARLWLDPLSESPTAELRVEGGKLDEAWVDHILMLFIERALLRV